MENQIERWITETEGLWLEKLHNHAEKLFSKVFIPSHDHTHHRRVWNNCRTLLEEIATFNPFLDQSLVEGLLIATYFHDLGMVLSTNEEHGSLGRKICESYFKKSSGILPPRFDEILDSIEFHDVKNEAISSTMEPVESPTILDILSVADDLEALGTIGIYRFIEIYLLRDSNLQNLGIRILGNASHRYRNLLMKCKNCPRLIKKYQVQYLDLVSFFDNYNQQLLTEPKPETVFYGHLGVVNYIRTLSLEGHTMPMDFSRKIQRDKSSTIVTNYFRALKNELIQAKCIP